MADTTDRVKIHFVYAVPAGGFDRGFNLTNAIPYLSSSANRWLAAHGQAAPRSLYVGRTCPTNE